MPTDLTIDPVCPRCKRADTSAWELHLKDGDCYVIRCDGCNMKFKVTASVVTKYRSAEYV